MVPGREEIVRDLAVVPAFDEVPVDHSSVGSIGQPAQGALDPRRPFLEALAQARRRVVPRRVDGCAV